MGRIQLFSYVFSHLPALFPARSSAVTLTKGLESRLDSGFVIGTD